MIRIPETRTKYGAKKTVIDGITFDSHKEARRYMELKRLKQAGTVTKIEPQPEFPLQDHYRKCCGRLYTGFWCENIKVCRHCGKKMPIVKAILYRADFRVTYADGHQEIEDVKGMQTPVFELKRKIFEYRYPELTLKLVRYCGHITEVSRI